MGAWLQESFGDYREIAHEGCSLAGRLGSKIRCSSVGHVLCDLSAVDGSAPGNSSTGVMGARTSSSAFSMGDEETQATRTRLEPMSHSEDTDMDMLVDCGFDENHDDAMTRFHIIRCCEDRRNAQRRSRSSRSAAGDWIRAGTR